MQEEERLDELKLANGKIWTSGGLWAFFAEYADAYVRWENHADVVGTVADC